MSLQATIVISNVATLTKWVDRITIECYSDVSLSTLVGVGYSSCTWDGTYNQQKTPVAFRGLVYGNTYYLRPGVICPITGRTTYGAAFPTVVGNVSAPESVTYTRTNGPVASGVWFEVIPDNPPTDIDHYEAHWTFDGSVPSASVRPYWQGHTTGGKFHFFVGGRAGDRPTVFVRAVNTSQKRQSWQNFTSFPVGTLDNVGDGGTYGRVLQDALQNGAIDPRKTGYMKLGSVNPAWIGQLTFDKGTNNIKWYWSGVAIRRVDGTVTSLADRTQANGINVTGLTANTTYYFYPFFDEFDLTFDFVRGGVGTDGGNGAAGIAQTARTDALAQSQALQDRQPISQGGIAVTTTASGTTTGGGGGTGCLRGVSMKVETEFRGIILARDVLIGERILSPEGEWRVVLNKQVTECSEFVRLRYASGEVLEQTPLTPMKAEDGQKFTCDLSLSDPMTMRGNKLDRLVGIELLRKEDDPDPKPEEWQKVELTIEAPNWFLSGTNANASTHNISYTG